MAETPSSPTQPHSSDPSGSRLYWCYHCDKRVSIADQPQNLADIKCVDCNSGFVESLLTAASLPSSPLPPRSPDPVGDSNFGSQFLQILRLISHSARDEEDSPPSPPPRPNLSNEDFLRIEIGGWENNEDNDDEEEEGEGQELEDVDDHEYRQRVEENRREIEDPRGGQLPEPEDEEDPRRIRRELLRIRIRDLATQTRIGSNRILDWTEVLMGLENNSIEFPLQVPELDRYVSHPDDYVDGAAYDVLLQTLAESEGGERRGAPPAAKLAIAALPTVVVSTNEEAVLCAVCKDMLSVGEAAKTLPCGHLYHGDCIEPWLATRNSCPVCRFELPTDDPEYEEERRKKGSAIDSGASGSGRADATSNWWD